MPECICRQEFDCCQYVYSRLAIFTKNVSSVRVSFTIHSFVGMHEIMHDARGCSIDQRGSNKQFKTRQFGNHPGALPRICRFALFCKIRFHHYVLHIHAISFFHHSGMLTLESFSLGVASDKFWGSHQLQFCFIVDRIICSGFI